MKHPKYPHIFEKGYINGIETKNRIVMSPMGTNLENADGTVNDKIIAYFEARAKGGAGIIIPGVVSVDYPVGKTIAHQLRLDNIKYVPGMSRLAEAVHRHDSLLILQIHHAGCSTMPIFLEGMQAVSASENPTMTGEMARALSTEEVKELIGKFITTAVYANMAGADGIELHAGHGYILSQFLSPATNRRTDEYGGSPENRMRILLEIVRGIRAACPPKFICGIRLSMEDSKEGGSDLKERQQVCIELEKAGVHYISATVGLTSPTDNRGTDSQRYADGNRVYMAKAAKDVVSIPVFAVGKLREPEMIDGILADGIADFIALGRPLLADPEWVNKTKSGNEARIRNCVSCLDGCICKVFRSQELVCALNPVLGQEYRLKEDEKAAVSKNVVVVGGGIAGMEAARSAALSGHKVTLIEKSNVLGGQLNLAKIPPNKSVLGKITKWYEGELKILGVDVKMGVAATSDMIESLSPDSVLIATGALPVVGRIPSDIPVINSWDILSGDAEMPKDKNVAIIGGGIVGCEVAHYIAEAGNKVTVFEKLPAIANGLTLPNMIDLKVAFAKYGIESKVSTTIEKIAADGIHYNNDAEGAKVFPADVYVSALGQVSNRGTLLDELEAKGIKARYIGDAKQVDKVMTAVKAGFYAGKDA